MFSYQGYYRLSGESDLNGHDLGVASLHAAKLRLPTVKGLLSYAATTHQLLACKPRLLLEQNIDDLFFTKTLLHEDLGQLCLAINSLSK